MSPRRKIQPGEAPPFVARAVAPSRLRRLARLPLMFGVAGLVIAEAITVCALVLVSHESQRRAAVRDVAVLADVRSFMTQFTSLDPFHANDYVDRVLAHATGEFAKQYQQKANLAALAVAKGEPTTGTVLDAGVERWNDDGSANVLVAAEVNGKSPDGKKTVDVASRWLVTAQKEGNQWKISSLVQVI
ncbi:mammalian cell entry protein [Mycobacterium sp.]|uniref:mammalian cell entry protein n=1 Tax=Mycobacterium sp. TaxID=1785 RepID=UPI0031DC6B81